MAGTEEVGLPSSADLDAVAEEIRIRWRCILEAIPDVDRWNVNMPRLVKENGKEFREFAQAEARRRGYVWAKTEYFHPWEMKPCSGKVLIGCGWRTGQLALVFASKGQHHRYESRSREVPVSIANEIVNSKAPDGLYSKLVKGKYEMVRVL